MKQLISPLKYYGGSYYKIRKFLEIIEWKPIYVECCLGGGNLILNSPDYTKDGKPIRKFAIDIDQDLIECWRVIQLHSTNIIKVVNHLFVFEDRASCLINFYESRQYEFTLQNWINHPVESAIMYLIRNRFSRAADLKTFGWSDRLRRGKPEYISAWETMIESLPAIAEKVKNVAFFSGSCVDVINEIVDIDRRDAVIYCDPPFVHESRVSKNVYSYEMPTEPLISSAILSHRELLEYALSTKCTWYLSGYHNYLYDELVGDKVLCEWDMKTSASQAKEKSSRREVLWRIN